jgi:hypothetical protein
MRVRHVTFTLDGISASGQRARSIAVKTLRDLSTRVDGSHRLTESAEVEVTAHSLNVEPDERLAQRTATAARRRFVRGGR